MPRNIKLAITFLLVLMLTTCTAAPVPTSTPAPTQTSTVTFTSTTTPTRIPSSTPSPMPSPTTDPVLLLPTYEPQEFLNHILYDDDICLLPCWGNIIPGEMTYDTAFRYLRPIIDLPEDHVYVPEIRIERRNGFRLISDDEGEWIRASFHYDSDGIIQLIETNRIGYDMQQLIQTYGRPQGFYFLSDYLLDDEYVTHLFFYYPQQHFMAVFTQVNDVKSVIAYSPSNKFLAPGEQLTLGVDFCDSKIETAESPALMIWTGELEFEALANLYYKKSGRHVLIEAVSDYASDEAIEDFFANTEKEDLCLDIGSPVEWFVSE